VYVESEHKFSSHLSVHVPPFWHGFGSHGKIRVSQSVPSYLKGQVHW